LNLQTPQVDTIQNALLNKSIPIYVKILRNMDISFTIDNFVWIHSSALRFAKICPNSTIEFNLNFIHQLMAVSSAININHRINTTSYIHKKVSLLHHTMARTKKTTRSKGVDRTWVYEEEYTDNNTTNTIDVSVNNKDDEVDGTSVGENSNDSNTDDNSLSGGDEEASRTTNNNGDDDGDDKNTWASNAMNASTKG
jgi:hypothetical protein